MSTGATAAVQARIDAQQDLDALVYGLRTLGDFKSSPLEYPKQYGSVPEWAVVQWEAAKEVAARFGYPIDLKAKAAAGYGWLDGAYELKQAKKDAQATLAAAREQVKAFGGVRQLRLALSAESPELVAIGGA